MEPLAFPRESSKLPQGILFIAWGELKAFPKENWVVWISIFFFSYLQHFFDDMCDHVLEDKLKGGEEETNTIKGL